MEQTTQEFFHNFKQELMAEAEADSNFQLAEFAESITKELMETGFVEGFEFCHFIRPKRGMRVDGYWFNEDEGVLDLFIADFESRNELDSLTETEVRAAFKRAAKFFEVSRNKDLYKALEETSPGYGLSRQIADRKGLIQRVNFYLLSERVLSSRLQTLDEDNIADTPASYHVWDISRLHRQQSSRGHKEELDINFEEMFGGSLPCLPVDAGSEIFHSYLIVIPGEVLADLYGKFGARLLEQNVRSFLQARGKVNKGIRSSILNESGMFFAYNNGITATAQEVEIKNGKQGCQIVRIKDLQIVNGGQTTASLFHTRRQDKASLEKVFIQMKLSVIPSEESETVVPKISEYANTQNRVNAADFFSNHPFHIRIEEFSRRIWAPAQKGEQRETKWFYERARGQYADAQSKLTRGEKKRFTAEYPRSQMFTKTDLAKFENVWDEEPRWVNLGAQKNFAQYAQRIGKEWSQDPEKFNEHYYKRVAARGIVFRCAEKTVFTQPWYGGYRANIVAYSIALINVCAARRKKAVNFMSIWDAQEAPGSLVEALAVVARYVNDDISDPPEGISNISEWCKNISCWKRLQENIDALEEQLPKSFWDDLIPIEQQKEEVRSARKDQRIDDGISAQKRVFEIPVEKWREISAFGQERSLFSPKELGVLKVAARIPDKIPTEKQCSVLLQVLKKAEEEGLAL